MKMNIMQFKKKITKVVVMIQLSNFKFQKTKVKKVINLATSTHQRLSLLSVVFSSFSTLSLPLLLILLIENSKALQKTKLEDQLMVKMATYYIMES